MRAKRRLLLRLPLGPGRHTFRPSALDGSPRLLHLCNASRGRLSSPRHPTMSGMARGVQRALTARPARLAWHGRTIMRADISAWPVSLKLSPGWQKPATRGTLAEPVGTLAKRLRRRAAPHITPLHLRRDSCEMQSTNASAPPRNKHAHEKRRHAPRMPPFASLGLCRFTCRQGDPHKCGCPHEPEYCRWPRPLRKRLESICTVRSRWCESCQSSSAPTGSSCHELVKIPLSARSTYLRFKQHSNEIQGNCDIKATFAGSVSGEYQQQA